MTAARTLIRDAGRLLAASALAAAAVLSSGGPARAATPEQLFEGANAAYDAGKFDEAAAAYEKIVAYRVLDPRVLYNLGNAYFKQGRLGPAILQYERALRLEPTDREIQDNLELARGQIRDRVAETDMQYPIRLAQSVVDAVPPNALSWLFLLAYVVTAGLLGTLVMSRSWVTRRLLGYGALLIGLVTVALGGGLAYKMHVASSAVAIVMQDKLDVRSGPGDENTVLFTVHEGTRMELRNRLDPWAQVSLPNGLSGWVPVSAIEKV